MAVTRANMLLLAAFAARSDGGDTYELEAPPLCSELRAARYMGLDASWPLGDALPRGLFKAYVANGAAPPPGDAAAVALPLDVVARMVAECVFD